MSAKTGKVLDYIKCYEIYSFLLFIILILFFLENLAFIISICYSFMYLKIFLVQWLRQYWPFMCNVYETLVFYAPIIWILAIFYTILPLPLSLNVFLRWLGYFNYFNYYIFLINIYVMDLITCFSPLKYVMCTI